LQRGRPQIMPHLRDRDARHDLPLQHFVTQFDVGPA
jgi:hypothetical protein